MEEFSDKMRSQLSGWLPGLASRFYRPDPHTESYIANLPTDSPADDPAVPRVSVLEGPPLEGEEEDLVIGGWLDEVLRDLEKERMELVQSRGLDGK